MTSDSESYGAHFDDKWQLQFANQVIQSGGPNYKKLAKDFVSFCDVDDFRQFPDYFSKIVLHLIENGATKDIANPVTNILRDYCRIQFAQRVRMNLIYKNYASYTVDYSAPVCKKFIFYTILKHERIMNQLRLENVLDTAETLIALLPGTDLENEITKYRVEIGRVVPPLPCVVPDYISNRRPESEGF